MWNLSQVILLHYFDLSNSPKKWLLLSQFYELINWGKSSTKVSNKQTNHNSIHCFISCKQLAPKNKFNGRRMGSVHHHDTGWKQLMLVNMIGRNDDLESVGIKDYKNLTCVSKFQQEAAMNGSLATSHGMRRGPGKFAFSWLPSVLQQIVNRFGKLVDLLLSFSAIFFHRGKNIESNVSTTYMALLPGPPA